MRRARFMTPAESLWRKVMSAQKCPVCGWEIKDQKHAVKVKGKTIAVCCDECAEKVKADPAKYAGK